MTKEELIKIIEERFVLIGGSDTFDTYVSINNYENIMITQHFSELEVTAELGQYFVSKININKISNNVSFISNLNLIEVNMEDLIEFRYIDSTEEIEDPREETDLGLVDEEDLNEEYVPQWELNKEGVVSDERYEELKNIKYIKQKYRKYYDNIVDCNHDIERLYWEKILNDEIWLTRDGAPIKFAELDEEHTKNIIKMLNEFAEIRCELEDVFGAIQLLLLKELIKKEEF